MPGWRRGRRGGSGRSGHQCRRECGEGARSGQEWRRVRRWSCVWNCSLPSNISLFKQQYGPVIFYAKGRQVQYHRSTIIMQVDRENLAELLPQILEHIAHAHFIAFDCEFSGLVTQLRRIEGSFPNHLEFYQRIKETALNFRIIQLGIAAFELVDGVYVPHVYNFYVSPSTFSTGFNNVMVCEVESMQFLAKNNLDFTRVFKHGIKTQRIYSNDPVQSNNFNQFPHVSHENMFLSPEEEEAAHFIQEILTPLIEDTKKERIVNFKNRTLFNYFKSKYPLMLFDKPKKNMQPMEYNIRMRPKEDEKPEFLDEKTVEIAQETEIKESEVMVAHGQGGEESSLREVFAAIIQGGKPIVGHFPNLDLGLIFQTFLKDLPPTYEEFCSQINYVFPWIFDTKVISRRLQSRLKGLKVDLGSLFKACSNPKLLKPYSNFSIKGLEQYVQKQHEAGYDAFITGCAFIGMANFLVGEPGKVNFEAIEQENKLLYSRFCGEVSINGNRFCSNAQHYDDTIIIQPFSMQAYPDWRITASTLSKYGSLAVHEDHGQIYYVYENPVKLAEILYLMPALQLRRYSERNYPRARNMYNLMF